MVHTLRDVSKAFLSSRAGRKNSTLSTYRRVLDCYILPVFGERDVSDLKCDEVNRLFFSLRGEDGRLLSTATVSLTATAFSAVMEYSNRADLSRFPCELILRPRVDHQDVSVLSVEEQQKLKEHCLSKALSCPDALGVLLNMYTGLRLGEICGLRWTDISPSGDRLTVRRTVQRVKSLENDIAEAPQSRAGQESRSPKTMILIDTPKSASSCRTIPIVSFIGKVLKKTRPEADCYILTGSDIPMEPRKLQRRYKKISEAAGIDYKNYHTIRHSFATNCATAGMDPKSLCEILGHSDVSTTFNTYVHPSFDIKKKFLEMLK